ncbi:MULTISPECIES: protoporphyrinogen oxidase [unclassified Psychrobacillus]|uniref:protoporphyrinogen oxidase n=1 Tax=unclassified Psychrobacillus TaxID=2636677 RepID=UPI00146D1B2D|nr:MULTISPECIES: protoporphyrinogen oxidase [unclassified Psychrobacillus]MCM3360078.1 protoporphyrinogen oxidase [Psychrobacillus sp. MER TA 171]NME06802.1 protoporphyrinogen oxidase [Psychrobacillus sp. BL-248-WT-3]
MKKVVVVGGGITGLSVMHYLHQLKNEKSLQFEMTLIESNEYLGGKIHSVHKDDFIMEVGADSIVARHESVLPLVEELGLEDELVYNATGISYLYTNNELHAIPADSVFGIPTSVESLESSTLVSDEGKEEALKDLDMPNEGFTKESSIGSFLKHFLGEELVEKQVAPVLSGVYSGDLDKLTMETTLPYLVDYKNQYGSIIKGLGANKEQFQKSANKKFISFKDGLSTLINGIEKELIDSTIIKGAYVTNIEQKDSMYYVSLSDHQVVEADYVILATPHDVAQKVLNHKELDTDFHKLKNSSLISIYLGFDIPDEQLPAEGTGYIVSENSDVKCNACTWTSRKWKHTSKNSKLLVRMFYKSTNPEFTQMKHMTEEELIEVAMKDIRNSLKLDGIPQVVEVTKWNDMMPNYHLQHAEAIKSLEKKMKELFPQVLLAGCSYYGVGIGPCIKNGKETAEQIVEKMK